MVDINPRLVAAEVLEDICENSSYSNIALKKALKSNGAMPLRDRAFVTELVNGSLRNILYIDYVLDNFSNTPVNKMKPWIKAVLRSAVYQVVFMNVPESAAVNEAVKLVKFRGYKSLSGFCNAVLRSVSKGYTALELPKDKAEMISIKYSHPLWLVKMWISYYGEEFTEELCRANTQKPDVVICCNSLKTDIKSLCQKLSESGAECVRSEYLENSAHISKVNDLSKLEPFKEGLFHVQDESSSLAVRILDPKEGENILDVCASPGGKTVLACELMKNRGMVTARDIFPHRLALINETAERLGINIIKTEEFDATVFNSSDVEKYDRVLVDAPCSGFGLMRKKADIRLKKNGNDIDSLIVLQRNILSTVWKYVKKGGVIVYSTCTISKKENEGNIKWFTENFPFETEDISEFLPENIKQDKTLNGCVQLFPNVHKTDGFFIARLRRKNI